MKKIIVKTCSCFLEKAVWFVNFLKRYHHWVFLCGVKNVSKKIFASDEWNDFKTVKNLLVFNKIMISCCLDCVKFEAVQNSKIMQCLDNVKCRFVAPDPNAFGESYDDEIFVGNCHKWKSAESEEISFNKRPLHKSCFTSLKKLRYEHFCTSCKKFFEEHFVENLYVFSRVRNW